MTTRVDGETAAPVDRLESLDSTDERRGGGGHSMHRDDIVHSARYLDFIPLSTSPMSMVGRFVPHRPLLSLTIAAAATTTFIFSRAMSSTTTSSPSPASTPTFKATPYTSRHRSWPYTASDFTRQDSSPDTSFYGPPRLVTHIDDAAIASLQSYYATVLPRRGRILDFCSSWISHYPDGITAAVKDGDLRVVGLGMNRAELDANPVLNAGRIVKDLNADPSLPEGVVAADGGEKGLLDAATCVVSIDYLTQPVEVLASLLDRTRVGGAVHLIISNRCFPTKAIGRWLRVDEEERLLMVGDFLHFAGWKDIEILDLKAPLEDGRGTGAQDGGSTSGAVRQGFGGLMRLMGVANEDPLWCVRARKGDGTATAAVSAKV